MTENSKIFEFSFPKSNYLKEFVKPNFEQKLRPQFETLCISIKEAIENDCTIGEGIRLSTINCFDLEFLKKKIAQNLYNAGWVLTELYISDEIYSNKIYFMIQKIMSESELFFIVEKNI